MRFGEYSTHELDLPPEAYEQRLNVDFSKLDPQDQVDPGASGLTCRYWIEPKQWRHAHPGWPKPSVCEFGQPAPRGYGQVGRAGPRRRRSPR
ncbi:hypothetical protein [Kitasatospora sp. NPDC089509]|uniref:hypothetical protein n=1 Tax=Kitasatospora sp. NPDC089509 TaxID=3364079 RepID=UPI00380573B8